MQDMVQFYPLGECAIVVKFGSHIHLDTHHKVTRVLHLLSDHPLPGIVEFVPAYTTLTIYYDPLQIIANDHHSPYHQIRQQLENILKRIDDKYEEKKSRQIKIPVCYEGDFAPDLAFVAELNGLEKEEVIQIHAGGEYFVYMIGFLPGFPYFGGMSDRITAPRHNKPRAHVKPGSVGIAGNQTGIYPLAAPGGWQLIGRTPISLFQPKSAQPSFLRVGDVVNFHPISRESFEDWGTLST